MDDSVLDQASGRGTVLLSCYGVAGLLDSFLEVFGAHRTVIIGDLDGALLEVGVDYLHPGELAQLALDGRLAVAAVHVRNPQRLLGHHHSFLLDDTRYTLRNRSTAAVSSSIFSSASSPCSTARRTQCSTWSLSTIAPTFSRAATTLAIWVRTSMQ